MSQEEDMQEGTPQAEERSKDAQTWRSDKAIQMELETEARRFMDDYVRQNSSKLVDAIQIEEHERFLEHTAEERLIYRQACHDLGIFDLEAGYDTVDLQSRAELLQRCAHFSSKILGVDATLAIKNLGEVTKQRIEDVKQQLRVECARAAI